MLPTIAIVGRPNVGKSTLFNVLTRTRDALVADFSGLTRDRKFGRGVVGDRDYLVIDTGGLTAGEADIDDMVTEQALLAVEEADSVLFIVDGRAGLTGEDQEIAQRLRTYSRKIHLVINKSEGLERAMVSAEFHQLGFPHLHVIAAAHGRGIGDMIEEVLDEFPLPPQPEESDEYFYEDDEEPIIEEEEDLTIKVAFVGRPNVGKSTLVNQILGYERVIAFDQPGTTRDSIEIPFERDGQEYVLIDTAGVRRRSRVEEMIEKFSIIKTLQAIEFAHVVVILLDATEGMTDQDANLIGSVLESGRCLVIAVNKWDGLSAEKRNSVKFDLTRRLHFVDFADIHFISALHGTGVGLLFKSMFKAWSAAHRQVTTSQLNQILERIVEKNPPPIVQGRRIKLRFMHQGGIHPPRFVIHGNQVKSMPEHYERYLINQLRNILKLHGTPISLSFKQGENPFEGRKNPLSPRQVHARKRMMRHVKRTKK